MSDKPDSKDAAESRSKLDALQAQIDMAKKECELEESRKKLVDMKDADARQKIEEISKRLDASQAKLNELNTKYKKEFEEFKKSVNYLPSDEKIYDPGRKESAGFKIDTDVGYLIGNLGRIANVAKIDPLNINNTISFAKCISTNDPEHIRELVDVLRTPTSTIEKSTLFSSTASETRENLAVGIDVGGSYSVFTGQLSASYQDVKKRSVSEKCVYIRFSASAKLSNLHLRHTPYLSKAVDSEFKYFVANLTPKLAKTMIRENGTHYVKSIATGGVAYGLYRMSLKTVAEAAAKSGCVSTHASVQTSMANAKFGSTFEYGSASAFTDVNSSSNWTVHCDGGTVPPSNTDSGTDFGPWLESLKGAQVPIEVKLVPIYNLLTRDIFPNDPDIEKKMEMFKTAVTEYYKEVGYDKDEPLMNPCYLYTMSPDGSMRSPFSRRDGCLPAFNKFRTVSYAYLSRLSWQDSFRKMGDEAINQLAKMEYYVNDPSPYNYIYGKCGEYFQLDNASFCKLYAANEMFPLFLVPEAHARSKVNISDYYRPGELFGIGEHVALRELVHSTRDNPNTPAFSASSQSNGNGYMICAIPSIPVFDPVRSFRTSENASLALATKSAQYNELGVKMLVREDQGRWLTMYGRSSVNDPYGSAEQYDSVLAANVGSYENLIKSRFEGSIFTITPIIPGRQILSESPVFIKSVSGYLCLGDQNTGTHEYRIAVSKTPVPWIIKNVPADKRAGLINTAVEAVNHI